MEHQLPSGLQPELLEDDQKQWLANAICGAITADGSIAPEELEYLERALSFLPTQTAVNNMMQAVKTQKLPHLERLPGATREMEVKIFIDIATVISVDNVLGANEIDYLLYIGRKLGFGREFVRVVIRWASEGIVLRRKMQHLIDAGSSLEAEYTD
ncbi:MAG: TerB family tellurite resistance protein [SAR324 cluster bacterium]|nr:TerB family tellurite resistance protein [SAR324 cluster bacterium]MBL7035802.1 TerB family tellurite resistance protein [SAR324 cluster bacterium]